MKAVEKIYFENIVKAVAFIVKAEKNIVKTEENIVKAVAFPFHICTVPDFLPSYCVRLIIGINFHACIEYYVTCSYLSDLSMFLD